VNVASAQTLSVGVACSQTTGGAVAVASTGLLSVSGGQYSLSGGSLTGLGTATCVSALSISGAVALSVSSVSGVEWRGVGLECSGVKWSGV
jgi:hypothetical protein